MIIAMPLLPRLIPNAKRPHSLSAERTLSAERARPTHSSLDEKARKKDRIENGLKGAPDALKGRSIPCTICIDFYQKEKEKKSEKGVLFRFRLARVRASVELYVCVYVCTCTWNTNAIRNEVFEISVSIIV